MMLCCTDLLDYHSTVDEETNEDLTQSCSDKSRGLPHSTAHEETNEDLTQSCSDKSRGLPQTSHSTEESVISSECVRIVCYYYTSIYMYMHIQ